jgi:tetratricopeptide (TPR) repeat protein
LGTTRQTAAFLGCVALLTATAVAIEVERDRRYPQDPIDSRLLYISSGRIMEKVSLSYDALMADVYWIRAIQHYGGARLNPQTTRRYDLLYPLLDLTTSLDPRFTVAYRFGAIFLAEPYPGGAGRPELAVALLEKGVKATPSNWNYYHDIGFVYYWHLHDYQRAAEWFSRGGERPGAPWWLKTYAAVMLTKGGNREASRFMWQNILQTAANDWLKQNAELRLMQLDALDQMDYLRRVVAEFERRTERLPASWEQVAAARLLPGIPSDPSGTLYLLNSNTGEVTVSGSSKMYPLPVEPAASPELGAASQAPAP